MLWRVLQSNGGLPIEAIVCFANTGKEDEATWLVKGKLKAANEQ